MEYRWILYCWTEKKVNCIDCTRVTCRTVAWRAEAQFTSMREKLWIGAVFKGRCPEFSSFPVALEQGFLSTTHWQPQPAHCLICRLRLIPARSKALLLNYLCYSALNCNWPGGTLRKEVDFSGCVDLVCSALWNVDRFSLSEENVQWQKHERRGPKVMWKSLKFFQEVTFFCFT